METTILTILKSVAILLVSLIVYISYYFARNEKEGSNNEIILKGFTWCLASSLILTFFAKTFSGPDTSEAISQVNYFSEGISFIFIVFVTDFVKGIIPSGSFFDIFLFFIIILFIPVLVGVSKRRG